MSTVDLGTFNPDHCTALDDKGILRVCDPRAWVMWLYAVTHGKIFRTSSYGFEIWEALPGEAYSHTTVKYSALGVVE